MSTFLPHWRTVALVCSVAFVALLVLFRSTAEGMVYIWYNRETYTHGFLILPISLWLIWQKKAHLAAFTPQPAAVLLSVVFGGLVLWALARLTGVLVVEQAALVTVIIGTLSSVLGWQITKFLAFPLLFLYFAVPMGEDLVPPMMEFTATFTVEAIKLTGIPVYRDGLWFSLPSGNWSVVEACSGVRYLIASLTLGVMYAYITYHTLWKRLLFIVMSVLVPVLANGVRAYMIVMIGHLSDMELATGVDHLIYGWVFFGVVMFILFWLGSLWREDEAAPEDVLSSQQTGDANINRNAVAIVSVALMASVATVWGVQRAENIEGGLRAPLALPDEVGAWRRAANPVTWTAAHQDNAHVLETRYRRGEREIQVHLLVYPRQSQGSEAISPDNRIAEDVVRRVELGARQVQMGDGDVAVNERRALIGTAGRPSEQLVWQWYRVAGRNLTNPYVGKAWEALARIYPGRADGAWIAVATAYEPQSAQAAEDALAEFVPQLAPQIDMAVDKAVGIVD